MSGRCRDPFHRDSFGNVSVQGKARSVRGSAAAPLVVGVAGRILGDGTSSSSLSVVFGNEPEEFSCLDCFAAEIVGKRHASLGKMQGLVLFEFSCVSDCFLLGEASGIGSHPGISDGGCVVVVAEEDHCERIDRVRRKLLLLLL